MAVYKHYLFRPRLKAGCQLAAFYRRLTAQHRTELNGTSWPWAAFRTLCSPVKYTLGQKEYHLFSSLLNQHSLTTKKQVSKSKPDFAAFILPSYFPPLSASVSRCRPSVIWKWLEHGSVWWWACWCWQPAFCLQSLRGKPWPQTTSLDWEHNAVWLHLYIYNHRQQWSTSLSAFHHFNSMFPQSDGVARVNPWRDLCFLLLCGQARSISCINNNVKKVPDQVVWIFQNWERTVLEAGGAAGSAATAVNGSVLKTAIHLHEKCLPPVTL